MSYGWHPQAHGAVDHPRRPPADRSGCGQGDAADLRHRLGTHQVSAEGPRSFRIGRGVRYWHNEVTTWLQSQSDGPTAA